VYRLQRFLSFAYKLRMGGELIGIEMKLWRSIPKHNLK
jgi:hypothetical protein